MGSSYASSSFISHESPAQSFLFDLTSPDLTDLASDFNEFNDFYKNETGYTKIERPQNPFHKNFLSYQRNDQAPPQPQPQRNSFSTFDLNTLLTTNVAEGSESPQEAEAVAGSAMRKHLSAKASTSGSNI